MSELLGSRAMAQFVADGFLRLDAVVPRELCEALLEQIEGRRLPHSFGNPDRREEFGSPFWSLWEGEPVGEVMRLPAVRGAIDSLVGPDPAFDHHYTHVVPAGHLEGQIWHQDSTIDPRDHAFDIQVFVFPHDTPREMGGTLVLPGSHLRRVHESEVGFYHNIRGQLPMVCEAGTVLIAHHGLWHCAQPNKTDRTRTMFKVRLNPTVRQRRLWDADDGEDVSDILARTQDWHGVETRVEIIRRIQLWRYLTGDERFDVDYWLTRLEHDPAEAVAS